MSVYLADWPSCYRGNEIPIIAQNPLICGSPAIFLPISIQAFAATIEAYADRNRSSTRNTRCPQIPITIGVSCSVSCRPYSHLQATTCSNTARRRCLWTIVEAPRPFHPSCSIVLICHRPKRSYELCAACDSIDS